MTPEEIGLNFRLIVAGFAGGLVNSLTFQAGWKAAVATTMAGTIVANYLGPAVAKFTDLPEPVAGFVCGMAALVMTHGVINTVQSKFKGGTQ